MRTPTIEWQVAGACNYDCSYCIQSKKYRRGRPAEEQISSALRFFGELPGVWEIKCSGGEAFAHPLFMQRIVPGLMSDTPHRISVLTNFSADREDLERFAGLVHGRLVVFSASLHLEFAEVDLFVEKASWFVGLLEPSVRFVVNQVVIPGEESVALQCKQRIEAAGLRWFPQLFKTKEGVAEYSDEVALRSVIGEAPGPREANLAPNYQGRMCWSGVEYFTVDKDGDAWSCRSAKRKGKGHLGNIYRGDFRLNAEPAPCPWSICPCTVPANRGMIEGVSSSIAAVEE